MRIGSFADASELGQLLHDAAGVPRCVLRNLYRNALGHVATADEEPALVALETSFAASGYRVHQLLGDIVASPAFRWVGDPK